MYKNFNISDEEKKQIMEQHKSHGYKQPINEDWSSFWSGVKNFFGKMASMQYGNPAHSGGYIPPGLLNQKTGTTKQSGGDSSNFKTKQAKSLSDVANGTYIYQGMNGDAVRELQSALNSMNDPEIKVDADGSFGPQTMTAVTKLQQKLGVKPSGKYGIFGPMTFKAMADKMSSAPTQPSNLEVADNQPIGSQQSTDNNQEVPDLEMK